jgi:hypothetical protein
MEMEIRQSDRIAYLPGHMQEGQSSNTQEHLFLVFDSSVTVLSSNRAVGLDWNGICIRLIIIFVIEVSLRY